MSDTPFVAFGNDELGDLIGDTIKCPSCGEPHSVEYGERIFKNEDGTERREPSKLLAYYKCGTSTYLCAINGRSVMK
jgi:hypothetical protein